MWGFSHPPQHKVLTPSLPDFHGPGTVLLKFLIRCDAFPENGPGGVMPRLQLKDPLLSLFLFFFLLVSVLRVHLFT